MIITIDDQPIATKPNRLVIGDRGAYLEIADTDIIKSAIEVQPGQEYRLRPEWRNKAFYAWYRTTKGHFKLYYQYRLVTYADYMIGYWYIDPTFIQPQDWNTR